MKLWKNNKLNQEWELEDKEIISRFKKNRYYKDYKDGMNLDRCLRGFICSKDGLSSVFEQEDYEKLMDTLLDSLRGVGN